MKGYYLYGAGRYVEYFVQLIRYLGDEVIGIVDRDLKKQGKSFCGIEVYPPEKLLSSEHEIIISCMATEEIRNIIKEMGIASREIPVADYLSEKYQTPLSQRNIPFHESILCFDLCSGEKWGGAENWNYFLADQYKKRTSGKSVMLISDEYKDEQFCDRVPLFKFSKDDGIKTIDDLLSNEEGISFVNSFFGHSFFAFLAMKMENPGKVRIITIVHNDYKDLYRACDMFKDYIDEFICVSSKIQKVVIGDCGVQENKVHFFYQPMYNCDQDFRKQSSDEIRIGVATRLTKPQKRLDYLPGIIDLLETKKIRYRMYIAGDGDFYKFLDEYIKKKHLHNKVLLLGKIEHNKMWDYWNNVDIYLNFSDFEGSSLAMLESMSCACVPIVTDVSGTRDYIQDGVNGFIVDVGDIGSLCERIEYFSNNKKEIEIMGEKARESVVEKCNVDSYIRKFSDILRDI